MSHAAHLRQLSNSKTCKIRNEIPEARFVMTSAFRSTCMSHWVAASFSHTGLLAWTRLLLSRGCQQNNAFIRFAWVCAVVALLGARLNASNYQCSNLIVSERPVTATAKDCALLLASAAGGLLTQ